MEAIGAVKQYEEAVAYIKVVNHQISLPTGFHAIIQIARNACYADSNDKGICAADVVVEAAPAEEKTASGILLTGSATEKPDTGIVVAIGKGKLLDNGTIIAMDVKVGDKVIFAKYSGQAIKIDGKELLVMREEEIFGIISK